MSYFTIMAASTAESGELGQAVTSGALGFAYSVGGWVGMVLAAVAVVVAVAALTIQVARRDKAPAGHKLPPVFSAKIPVVGNFIEFARDPLGFVAEGRKQCGQVFTIDMLAEKCTFLIGAEAHKAFFEATDEELDQAPVYQFMTPIFGKGVVYDTPLKKRRQQMRALGKSLRPSTLKTYPPVIARETREYLEANWGESGTVDLLKTMAQLIINTASATLLGPEIRGEMFDEMSQLYALLDEGLTPLSIFFPYAPTTAHRHRDKARVEIAKLFGRILDERRRDPEPGVKRTDVIQALMDFEYSDGTKFTDDEIAGMILATLFAGQHTSSIVSTWTLLFLMEDKRNKGGKVLDRVLNELAELEPTPGAFAAGEGVTHDVVKEQTELYKVVKEAIRMFPPLIMLMRRVTKPLVLSDGTYVPVGHRAMVSNAIAQRLPEVFDRPNEFDPSRWDEFNIAKLPSYSFIGFGAGIHTCMGESFAFMQARSILTVILSTYELELVTPFPEPSYDAMVVPPKGPNMVRFKRRAVPLSAANSSTNNKSAASVPKPMPTPEFDSATAVGAAHDIAHDEDEKTEFTAEEVAKHNTKDSLWIIVKDKVYDVTNYLDVHQGGDNAIINWGGKDATDAVFGPQHPSTVAVLLNRYEIGTLIKKKT